MSLSDLFSPKVEGILSAIPQLIGAYETARGKPIGSALSLLGQFGQTNAENRLKKGDVDALTKLAQGFNAQDEPIATGQFNQLQPNLANMTPEMAEKQLENIQNIGVSEQQLTEKGKSQLKFTKDGRIFEYFPQEKDPQKRLVERKELEVPGTSNNQYNTAFKAYMSGDPVLMQKVRDYENMVNQGHVQEQLQSFAGKLGMNAKQPAAKFGLVSLGPNGTPMAGGTLGDVESNGGILKSDMASYSQANLGIETAKRAQQMAYELNQKAPSLFPKAPNLITTFGDISVPIIKRLAPQLYQPLQVAVMGLADQLAKSQLGGRAQQAAMALQQAIRDPHATLTSLTQSTNQAQHVLEDEKESRLLRGKNQATSIFQQLQGGVTGFGVPSYQNDETVPTEEDHSETLTPNEGNL